MMSSGEGTRTFQQFGGSQDRRGHLLDIITMNLRRGGRRRGMGRRCSPSLGVAQWHQAAPTPLFRVFARIDPDRFRDCFRAWVSSIHRLTQGQVIAVDGKTLRRSHDRRAGKEAIHMVSPGPRKTPWCRRYGRMQ